MGRCREIATVLVATLAVSVCLAVYPGRSEDIGYAIVAFNSAFVSFCAVLILGAPTHVSQQEWRWTAFCIAAAVGFCVAAVGWFAANLLMALAVSPTPLSSLARLRWLAAIAWPFGPGGAVVGGALWLIGRPDRSHD
jgi:hypothetical protein